MHRIIGLLPGRQVASRVPAIVRRDRQGIIVVDVAQIAGDVCVPIGQCESSRVVVKHSCCPRRDRVACRASRGCGRESRRDVIRNRPSDRRRADESGLVTPVAIRRIEIVVVAHMARCAGRWRR